MQGIPLVPGTKMRGRRATIAAALLLMGCATYEVPRPRNAPGRPTSYQDPSTPGGPQGIGIESQDIVSMADRMVRDLLANPTIMSSRDPTVVIDARYFRNESSSVVNPNLITDALRVELARASEGRMSFVGAEYASMIGDADVDGHDRAAAKNEALLLQNVDFRLGGRVASLDARSPFTGEASRYHQITFELVDLATGRIVWSGMYRFKKTALDDVLYR